MTTYDPEDQNERRRVGGLLHESAELGMKGLGGQNSSTSAEPQLSSQNFCSFPHRVLAERSTGAGVSMKQRPLFSRKRTLELSREMSALCQKRTHAVQHRTDGR